MKKILAIVLAMVIISTLTATAFAANLDGNGFSVASSDADIPMNCTHIVTFSLQLANGNSAVIGKYYETKNVPETYWVCEGSINYMLSTAVPGMTIQTAPENLVITVEPTKAHGELGEYVLVENNPRIILVKETGCAAYYVKSATQTSEEIPATSDELPVTTGYSEKLEKIINFFSRLIEVFGKLYGSEIVAE